MKKVYITEERIPMVAEMIERSGQGVDELRRSLRRTLNEGREEEFTFFQFFHQVKKFIERLLNDPINARPSEELVRRGLTNDVLRKTLQNEGVIVKSENIKEPHDETSGKIESRYYLSYKVPRKDFKRKLRRMYQKMFQK